jgi:hypothetical protein
MEGQMTHIISEVSVMSGKMNSDSLPMLIICIITKGSALTKDLHKMTQVFIVGW